MIRRMTEAEFAELPALAYDWSAIEGIPGWLAFDAAELTRRLAALQEGLGVRGGALELGVYKGKYLGLLAALFGRRGEPIVGVDAFLARLGELLADEWRADAIARIEDAVLEVTGGLVRPTIIAGYTSAVSVATLRLLSPQGFRFISIDAGHDVEAVHHDLVLARQCLGEAGIIAADDAFNPRTPGVAEGIYRFFISEDSGGLQPFAHCGNKLFITTAGFYPLCLEYLWWLLRSGSDGTLQRTLARMQEDEAMNYRPMLFGSLIIPFS